MQTLYDAHIQKIAESCVNSMGDIFWDFYEGRDAPFGLVEPSQAAIQSVVSALQTLATSVESNQIYTIPLRLEYREIVARIKDDAEDADIVAAIVSEAAWTENGGHTILQLAQTYGMSVLRSALALAEALDIEHGQAAL